jgi:hypothetical protein
VKRDPSTLTVSIVTVMSENTEFTLLLSYIDNSIISYCKLFPSDWLYLIVSANKTPNPYIFGESRIFCNEKNCKTGER